MPIRTQKVKMETRVDKVGSSNGNSRLKSTELSGGISLHDINSGDRICQNAKIEDLKVLRFGSWRYTNAA